MFLSSERDDDDDTPAFLTAASSVSISPRFASVIYAGQERISEADLPHLSGGEFAIKCVMLGDGACGKTSFSVRVTSNNFDSDWVPTCADNATINCSFFGGNFEISLWDTAGGEDYDRLRRLSYMQTDVFLVCYDVSSPWSLTNIEEKWAAEVTKYCRHELDPGDVDDEDAFHPHSPDAQFILVGLKADLREDAEYLSNPRRDPLVDPTDVMRVAARVGAISCLECSSKTPFEIESVLREVVLVHLLAHERSRIRPSLVKRLFSRSSYSTSVISLADYSRRFKSKWVQAVEEEDAVAVERLREERTEGIRDCQEWFSHFGRNLSRDVIRLILNEYHLVRWTDFLAFQSKNARVARDVSLELPITPEKIQFECFGRFKEEKTIIFQLFFHFEILYYGFGRFVYWPKMKKSLQMRPDYRGVAREITFREEYGDVVLYDEFKRTELAFMVGFGRNDPKLFATLRHMHVATYETGYEFGSSFIEPFTAIERFTLERTGRLRGFDRVMNHQYPNELKIATLKTLVFLNRSMANVRLIPEQLPSLIALHIRHTYCPTFPLVQHQIDQIANFGNLQTLLLQNLEFGVDDLEVMIEGNRGLERLGLLCCKMPFTGLQVQIATLLDRGLKLFGLIVPKESDVLGEEVERGEIEGAGLVDSLLELLLLARQVCFYVGWMDGEETGVVRKTEEEYFDRELRDVLEDWLVTMK